MDELIGEFLVESYEGLDLLDQNFIDLEEHPDDIKTITEAFRILHTIKGTCGFLGFGQLEIVAHRGENLLSLLRDSVLSMDAPIADALLATVDAIRAILATIEETEQEGEHDNAALIVRLEQLGGLASQPEASGGEAAEPSSPDPGREGEADEAPVEAGADAPVAAEPAVEGAPAQPEAPVVGEPVAAEVAVSETAGESTVEASELPVTTDPGLSQPDDESPASETAGLGPDSPSAAADDVRIGDLLVEDGSAERLDVEIAAAEQNLGDNRKLGAILVDDGRAKAEDVEKASTKQRGAADSSVRVDVVALDRLMNLVGELVLARNQLMQLASEQEHRVFAGPAQRLNLITSELQEGVMRTRMQPIGAVWSKLPRVVRDLSQQFGKQIKLEMEGKETELDRTVLEAIKDPLTHMVRNTVDHGIEDPDVRVAAGKDPEGTLRLSASHKGGRVNIEISDDGAGINPAKMREKAVEKGILTAEAAEAMSDDEAIRLIFAAGFSTAEKVSNVSGRGVGMDVVRNNVERTGGSVDVKTVYGSGTTFTIKIPLTLAIVPAITVRCGGARFAIPQVNLEELVRLDPTNPSHRIEDLHGAPVYRLRDSLLPIVDLRDLLQVERADDAAVNIVVLQVDGTTFGLVVDMIENTEEIVVKPLGREVNDIEVFSGATIMGDGKVALILDVQGLAASVDLLKAGGRGEESSKEAGHGTQHDGSVGVIDDRTLLLVEFDEGHRAAIPLSDVERLEEFTSDLLEDSGQQTVVQYRGSILPILDLGPTTGMGGSAFGGDGRISAVVCSYKGLSVGLAVGSILDIVSGAEIHPPVGGSAETAIIEGHVADVIDVGQLLENHFPMFDPIGALV